MCEMACSLEKEGECNRTYSRIKVAKFNEGLDVPTVCLQCEEPICEDKCPVKAIARDANGALVIDARYFLAIEERAKLLERGGWPKGDADAKE